MGLFTSDNNNNAAVHAVDEKIQSVINSTKTAGKAVTEGTQEMDLGDVEAHGEGSKVDITQEYKSTQTAGLAAANVDHAALTNAATKEIEQDSTIKAEGGFMGPDSNNNTVTDTASRLVNAAASYSVTTLHAVSTIHQTLKAGKISATAGGWATVSQKADLVNKLKIKSSTLKEVTGTNVSEDTYKQTLTTETKTDMVAGIQAVTGMLGDMANALAGLMGSGMLFALVGFLAVVMFVPSVLKAMSGGGSGALAGGGAAGFADGAQQVFARQKAAQWRKGGWISLLVIAGAAVALVALGHYTGYDYFAMYGYATSLLTIFTMLLVTHFLFLKGHVPAVPTGQGVPWAGGQGVAQPLMPSPVVQGVVQGLPVQQALPVPQYQYPQVPQQVPQVTPAPSAPNAGIVIKTAP
jgi:hypothetical protein